MKITDTLIERLELMLDKYAMKEEYKQLENLSDNDDSEYSEYSEYSGKINN